MYVPPKSSHKGENGRLQIIAGSRMYHGAAMLTILAAKRFVDLVYFTPGEKDSYLLQTVKAIPEVIVADRSGEADAILFGNGIGNAKVKLPKTNAKLVIDADGLKRIRGKIPKNAILTPHEGEFKRLFGCDGTKENVRKMAVKHKCTILKKGDADIISDGKRIAINRVHNPGMTKGGTGDVLAGLVAALACKNDSFEACVAAARVSGEAGNILMRYYGYNYSASDIAHMLPFAYKKVIK
ncbi:NAD(P)H-hydrate dehydratase [Candidatus Micrarchaeota archaeon]|nr:NAD(P)H-hydrate dehydratase [Candidatus Micrarchaeota archaeon]